MLILCLTRLSVHHLTFVTPKLIVAGRTAVGVMHRDVRVENLWVSGEHVTPTLIQYHTLQ